MSKVYFVGAGPGAKDLITLRGRELIEKAQMIIYAGSLVNPELLDYASKDAEIYDSAFMTLDEVVEKYKDAQKRDMDVVRLHTGDPSIYGAIREQMEALDEMGMEYESCPGVSACFGASSTLNLEYTLPGISQSLIITRMAGRTQVPEDESIENFAKHQCSMAIYLSTGHIEELVERLIKGGYTPDTPAAVVYKATWPDEIAIISTLKDIAEECKKREIKKTAMILVGDCIDPVEFQKSKLYDKDFATEFRPVEGENKK